MTDQTYKLIACTRDLETGVKDVKGFLLTRDKFIQVMGSITTHGCLQIDGSECLVIQHRLDLGNNEHTLIIKYKK